uniref:Dynein assembly factor with WD repeat domains 1 n=1 Tax=Capra hircus TaxID=9925 RepID=A0A8C2NJ66_CAPHI
PRRRSRILRYCCHHKCFIFVYFLGIMLEYEKSGQLKTKSIDLLDLDPSTDVSALVEEIQKAEPLITASRSDQVKLLIQRLQNKLGQHSNHKFYLFKVIDKIATGSFDKTCKLWSVETGKCYHTFRGHTAEISEPFSFCRKVYTLIGHCAEISSALFNWDCSLILTGSMDKTCKLWDAVNGKCVATLTGHDDEILDSCFDYAGKLIATASADGTARIFSAATRNCVTKLEGHEGEISKISFNPQGNRLLTGSSDKTARIWDAQTGQCLQVLEGHMDEIFSCAFNYKGDIIITGRGEINPINSALLSNWLLEFLS